MSTLTKFSGERKDAYATPFSRWVQDPSEFFIAGVEIQATATLNLLRGDWLNRGLGSVDNFEGRRFAGLGNPGPFSFGLQVFDQAAQTFDLLLKPFSFKLAPRESR